MWTYICFTGITTGFSGHSIKERATEELNELQKFCNEYAFNKQFKVEYIENFNKIPTGEMVVKDVLITIT